jgi:hypothetical protein
MVQKLSQSTQRSVHSIDLLKASLKHPSQVVCTTEKVKVVLCSTYSQIYSIILLKQHKSVHSIDLLKQHIMQTNNDQYKSPFIQFARTTQKSSCLTYNTKSQSHFTFNKTVKCIQSFYSNNTKVGPFNQLAQTT